MIIFLLLNLFSVSIATSTLSSTSTKKFFIFNSKFGNQNIRYQEYKAISRNLKSFLPWEKSETKGNVLCLHGFGGNSDQFRKNLPYLANSGYNSYAIDLLGYGYSDKPNPKLYAVNEIYNFDTWADQTISFIEEKIKEPVYLICNSVGGVAGLTVTVKRPDLIKGVVLINISLRLLHIKKQNPLQRPVTSFIQTVLRETNLGRAFFSQVAQPKVLKNILSQAYADNSVDDEIVDIILKPGLEPGAADVFLDFISYSGGPLPEELLPQCQQPVRILWGENDPWEPIQLGKELAQFKCVDEFVPLSGGGHCPMDQISDQVNFELLRFLQSFSS